QAEDGIRDATVTGVQTCALPISVTSAEVTALLPKDRPRYLMGVGRPEQIADYVALGIDMMDCVLPTRAARHACLYTSEGRVLIKIGRASCRERGYNSEVDGSRKK